MDVRPFICALRRFFAICGPVPKIQYHQGTNFVGGKLQLEDVLLKMDQMRIQKVTAEQGCEWVFNPPHVSHFGGVWECQIGTVRHVLDAMLMKIGRSQLTHKLLVEVTGIVNSHPITTIPSDTDKPQPLTPTMLLTMKAHPLGPTPGQFIRQDLYVRNWWRKAQYLADQFWVRWKEYVQDLQKRPKWMTHERILTAHFNSANKFTIKIQKLCAG